MDFGLNDLLVFEFSVFVICLIEELENTGAVHYVTSPKMGNFSNATVRTSELATLLLFPFLRVRVKLPFVVENKFRQTCFKMLLRTGDATHL